MKKIIAAICITLTGTMILDPLACSALVLMYTCSACTANSYPFIHEEPDSWNDATIKDEDFETLWVIWSE